MHETLSQTFDEKVAFDEVADQLRAMIGDVSSTGAIGDLGTPSGLVRRPIRAEIATPLAMVLTEILQNAVEHGFAGRQPGHVDVDRPGSRRTAPGHA